MIRTLAIALLALALGGCSGDKNKSAKKEPPAQPTPPTEPPLEAPTISDEDLPVPSDFEAAVETEITEQNYKDQLAGLQKEIEAE